QARGRELGAEPREMDVDGPRLDEAVLSPDEVEELLPPEDTARRAHKCGEQLEFLEREVDALALHGDFEAVTIDLELAGFEVHFPIRRVRGLPPTHHRAHPGQQLTR